MPLPFLDLPIVLAPLGGAATVTLPPTTLPQPQVNIAYSQTLSASGGVAPAIHLYDANGNPLTLRRRDFIAAARE